MRKILFFVLFAFGLTGIYAFDKTKYDDYPRAYITSILIYDDVNVLSTDGTTLNINFYQAGKVTYQYWNANYPYNGYKYVGKINKWIYSFNLSNFYDYYPIFNTLLSQFNNPTMRIYIKKPNYTPYEIRVERAGGGYWSQVLDKNTNKIYEDDDRIIYEDPNFEDIPPQILSAYRVITEIKINDGEELINMNLYNEVDYNRLKY